MFEEEQERKRKKERHLLYTKTENHKRIQRDVMDMTQRSNPITPNICSYFNKYKYEGEKTNKKNHEVKHVTQ